MITWPKAETNFTDTLRFELGLKFDGRVQKRSKMDKKGVKKRF